MIESKATRLFWRMLSSLPEGVQREAKQAYRLFRSNPSHPSLHFKKVDEEIYSIRIGLNYRALGSLKGSRIVWFWIGSHAEYDRLV